MCHSFTLQISYIGHKLTEDTAGGQIMQISQKKGHLVKFQPDTTYHFNGKKLFFCIFYC